MWPQNGPCFLRIYSQRGEIDSTLHQCYLDRCKACVAAEDLKRDPYLIAALAGTRPWTVLFAVSACLLATIVLIGLAYIVGKLRGSLSSTLVMPVIVSTLYVIVLYAGGILALRYNARIGTFIRAGTSSRLQAALAAQRAFWALLSIALTVFTLYVIFLLIQVIQLVNTMSDAA